MLSKEEMRKMGLLGGKITYKSPVTGKMRTVTVDGENCGVLSKEEAEIFCYNGRKDTKFFSEVEETERYNERLKKKDD